MANPNTVDKVELRRLLEQGLSGVQIARALGISEGTVCYHRRLLGIPGNQGFAASADDQARELGYADLGAALADLAPKRTVNNLAELFGCTYNHMWNWLHWRGLTARPDSHTYDLQEPNRIAQELGYSDLRSSIAELLQAGKTNMEIAGRLCITRQTVGKYRRRLGIPNLPRPTAPAPTAPAPPVPPPAKEHRPGRPHSAWSHQSATPRAQWLARVAAMRIPEPRRDGRPLRLLPGERWCTRCGEVVSGGECLRCGSRQAVPAAAVLRAGEYVVA
jgi:DNA-binding CsgD family transcriptional regulator